jgi:hypothetical protein
MPKIIFKCRYLKNGAGNHLSNVVNYIATRNGVDKMDDSEKNLPATAGQQNLITKITEEFHETAGMFEYSDYLTEQTRGNASEFISCAIDSNYDLVEKKKNYVDYIANRPHVEKIGSHGLFTATDDPVVISKVGEEIASHQGNVWTDIISIRREDANRLGYDNAKMWKALLRAHANDIAANMKIAPENFRWYAAMHNESFHPHVHLIAYSINPKEAYLTEKGIENIKADLAKDIFRQDLMQIYTEQTKVRDELTNDSKYVMQDIVSQIQNGRYKDEKVEQLLTELSRRLKNVGGKKVYGYLKSDVKIIIDNIVDELAKDEELTKLYDIWYEQRYAVLKTYTETLPPKQPLSRQKEFKTIKNMVITEAMNLSNYYNTFKEELEPEEMQFLEQRKKESSNYTDGVNKQESQKAKYAESPAFTTPNMFVLNAVARLFKHCSQILINETSKKGKNEMQVDKKLRREIDEKKQAHGIRI